MAYIGKIPATGAFQKCDALSASATADYTLQVGSTNVVPESVNHMIVSLNGVIQSPTTAYTVSGAVLSFASALTSADTIDFVMLLGNVLDIGTPSDATVTNAKLASDLISGETDIGAAIADADLLLLDDGAGGTLRKSAASRLKTYTAQGHSSVYLTGDAAISGDSYLSSSLGIYSQSDAGTGIVTSVTSGHITLDKTGWYLCIYQATGSASSGSDSWRPVIYTWNGSAESSQAYSYQSVNSADGAYQTTTTHVLVDVSDVSTVMLHMGYASASNITLLATGQSVTSMTLIRLGDT